ncbi:MAG: aminoglycoside phosphotransferase family protein [Dehalococcoidia bacterium]|nr:aminoglycoside phosphotransferase family protein [Dehalococcoidia bacterium]
MATPPPHLRRRPPPEALAWVERALGAGTRVTSVRRLRGGTSAAVHLLGVSGAPRGLEAVVLRRFVRTEWLAEEPDVAEREARVLGALRRSGLPVPECLAADVTGSECDVPAVLMTRVPGRIELQPRDLSDYLRQLASFLPALHALGTVEGLPVYRPWFRSRPFEVPAWSRRPDLWLRANELASAPPPDVTPTLIHRDYHPANTLWRYGRLSGVTDWVNACNGPPGNDVAHCRVNLSALFGIAAAEEFREAYESVAGVSQHPYWDLLDALDTSPPASGQWNDAGRIDLTNDVLRPRVEAYLEGLVHRLN